MRQFNNIIIGFDPGLRTTGWGVISLTGSNLTSIASGSITPDPKKALGDRLLFIEKNVSEVVKEFKPHKAGIEKAFVGVNVESAFLLGAAQAACLISISRHAIPILQYAATHIKKVITGSGRADKTQISYMVKALLPTSQYKNEHEADALAIALTAAWEKTPLKEAV